MIKDKRVRVRFAPSPTGFLHIGGLRTALFNWLFAKKHQGSFILRIEDTDRERFVSESLQDIKDSLRWYGLDWDEGPDRGGDYGPYLQSERLQLYRKHAKKLLDQGNAYHCFCTTERLAKMREEQQSRGVASKYDGTCLKLSPQGVGQRLNKKVPHVIRLKTPGQGSSIFKDLIRGTVKFDYKEIDDQILIKSDGFPTYHLAVVVDDHLMEISHVIRGEEWLPSTPKHLLLFQYFGWEAPQMAHLPMILGPDKSKLSKRHGALSALEYRNLGYLPEAVINFIALLGWNPKTEQEIFNREQLAKEFALEKVNKAGSIFNLKKLDWLNGHYLRQLDLEQFAELALPYLQKDGVKLKDGQFNKQAVSLEQARIRKLSEITEAVSFLFLESLEYDAKLLFWKDMAKEEVISSLNLAKEKFNQIEEKDFHFATLELLLKDLIKEKGIEPGKFFWPLRVALSGREASPSPFEIAWVIGKKRTISRIEQSLDLLK